MALIEDWQNIAAPPSIRRDLDWVVLPVLSEAKISLYREMGTAGIGKAELARRLHCPLPQVDRLLNLAHRARLDQIEEAFLALGKRLVISLEDAA